MKNNEEIRKLAEEKAALSPEVIATMSAIDIEKMIHELQVHQIELEMQNEELRNTQLALDASKARYFDLYDMAPVGYICINNSGIIIEANLTIATLLGVSRHRLINRSLSLFILKEDQNFYYEHRKHLFETNESQTFEIRLTKKDGTIFWAYLTAIAVPDGDETVCRMTLSDVTERKQIEEVQLFLAQTSTLVIDESFFNSLARYLAEILKMDFICIDRLEGDGLYARTLAVWCDGQFEDNVTYALKDTPCGDVVGKTVCCFPASVCQFFPSDQVLVDLRAESYVGVTLFSHTGEPIGLIAVIGRQELKNRKAVESILKLVSIRASGELERLYEEEKRKSLELQLLQSQKMESVGRLAGGVAHDFNNMLQVILGNAYLAIDEVSDDSSIKQSLKEIIECGNRSADLTRNLLTFARKQIVLPQVIDLNDVTKVMLKMLNVLIGENINVSRIIGCNLWPVKVDPSQIDQILVNLCVNARDAINDIGNITIETKNCTLDALYCYAYAGLIPGDYVRISVSDNGCGMDKETMEHIFEPFFTTKEFGKGTGLGLATVYGAVKQNNGYIYTYSELGKGTTFTIFFPRYIEETIPTVNSIEKKPVPGGNETILLVEDESSILKLANRMLTQIGYNILIASSPGEAIQLANAYDYQINLLITDVIMPNMNGYDLSQQLINIFPKMKVLYMSGYTSDIIAERGVLEEGMHFLQKPFSLGDIAIKVREALGEG